MSAPRVIVVGGGLAGMTAAYELSSGGMDVLLLEASSRLGGKAGADRIGEDCQEHGNHFFPGWYLNTRRLMRELGILDNLVDMTRLHQLRRGRYPRFETLVTPTRLSQIPRNIVVGNHLPVTASALLVYSFLDLACEADVESSALDDMSLDEFLASRPYAAPQVRRGADAMVVRSIATPTARLSAKTKRAIVRHWLRHRVPMYSVLNANLQHGLIAPFERALRALGCQIELGCRVHGFERSGGRIANVRANGTAIAGDLFVCAVPCEAIGGTMDPQLLADAGLEGTQRLESVPMGAMTLYLKRRIPGLPKEHVILDGSRHALSFIDVSQTWSGCTGAVLTFNIGDVRPLAALPPAVASARVVDELCSYVPEIAHADVDRCHFRLNADTPLLMNSTGSWRHRPAAGRTRVPNLFVAGDYCRSAVNITSMEGAVASAVSAAGAILAEHGRPVRWTVLESPAPPDRLLKGIRTVLAPAMALLGRVRRLERGARMRGEDDATSSGHAGM